MGKKNFAMRCIFDLEEKVGATTALAYHCTGEDREEGSAQVGTVLADLPKEPYDGENEARYDKEGPKNFMGLHDVCIMIKVPGDFEEIFLG